MLYVREMLYVLFCFYTLFYRCFISQNSNLTSRISIMQSASAFVVETDIYSAGALLSLDDVHTHDDSIYLSNNTIRFRRSGKIRFSLNISGAPGTGTSRVWIRLQRGPNPDAQVIQYGDYCTITTTKTMEVDTSSIVSVSTVEAFNCNSGGTGPSYIEFQWVC